MKIVICDLDGTLFKIDERLKYITGEKKDWEGFFSDEAIRTDKPHPWCVEILRGVQKMDHEIVFVSGRNEVAKESTQRWLDNLGFGGCALFMRPAKNRDEDFKLKSNFYDSFLKDREVLFVLEDRKQVVDMWREKGLTVLQCADGEF